MQREMIIMCKRILLVTAVLAFVATASATGQYVGIVVTTGNGSIGFSKIVPKAAFSAESKSSITQLAEGGEKLSVGNHVEESKGPGDSFYLLHLSRLLLYWIRR